MRKFLAVLLVLFFSFVLPASIILLGAEKTLLKAEYYKTEFVRQNTYQLVFDTFNAGFRKQGNTELSSKVDWWGVEQIVNTGFSANWLKLNTEQVVDGIFGTLEPQGKLADLGENVLDFSEPRNKLSALIKTSTEKNLQKLPECNTEELKNLVEKNTKITELTCLPANFSSLRDQAPEEITTGLLGVVPEKINALGAATFFLDLGKQQAPEKTEELFKQLAERPDTAKYPELITWQNSLDQIHFWLMITHYIILGGIILSILCLIIILLLFWNKWRTILHWWSFCLIWAGINGLGIVLPLKLFFLQRQFLEPLLASVLQISGPLTALSSMSAQIMQGVFNGYINLVCWYTGGILGLGIILLIISFFVKNSVQYAAQNGEQNSVVQPKQ